MNYLKDEINNKSAFFFDLFHTLTSIEETSPSISTTSDILCVDKDLWNEQLLNNSIKRLTGKEKNPYIIIQRMAHAINPNIPYEIIKKATEARIELFKNAIIKMPQRSIDTIIYLKSINKKIALISNADILEKMAWDYSDISQYFDAAIFSCDVGYVKPQKEIYEITLQYINEGSSNCIFIGDGSSNELYGAKMLGFTTVMVKGIIEKIWPDKIEDRKKYADYIINDVIELMI
ncbi:MAG: HAD family hydrolase [Actinobacteria bacterium]|nr:HAD family hydrolase [Actinomycetota bacterium]